MSPSKSKMSPATRPPYGGAPPEPRTFGRIQARWTRPDAPKRRGVPSLAGVTDPVARPYAPSALPSTTARLLAFLAIVVGGVCGGVIGWSVTDLQCGPERRAGAEQTVDEDDDGCGTIAGI